MQGLFYSVTATFTTLVLALILFVVEHYHQFSSTELADAQHTKAQAIDFLEVIQRDISRMADVTRLGASEDYTCHVSMTRNGRTKSFSFPMIQHLEAGESPDIVQVTYELQGQAREVRTRNGKRDLYRLRRFINDGTTTEIRSGGTNQIVDFLIELIPHRNTTGPVERIVSGACPASLNQVYVEFRVAVNDTPTYATVSRYSSTIDRLFGDEEPIEIVEKFRPVVRRY